VRRAEILATALWRNLWREDWRFAPVDLRTVADYLGVEILTWYPNENRLHGALIRSAGTVFVNASLTRPRMRFAAAHELGHYVLGHEGNFFCPYGRYAAQEREANVFAAALLMPAAVIKLFWLKLGNVAPAARVAAVAERLAVSRRALSCRLETVGLANHAPRARARLT